MALTKAASLKPKANHAGSGRLSPDDRAKLRADRAARRSEAERLAKEQEASPIPPPTPAPRRAPRRPAPSEK